MPRLHPEKRLRGAVAFGSLEKKTLASAASAVRGSPGHAYRLRGLGQASCGLR